MSANKESVLYDGFQIDSDGNINFPAIGKVKVRGLSTIEVRNKLFNLIVKKDILINPFIDVKHINAYFTVLGEVNMPGKHVFINNNLNLIEAIGIAGDMTINGVRNDVVLIRNTGDSSKSYSVDLTNTSFLKEEYFQVFSGDIIIVKPNNSRVKNAGIIGNSGTLLSLLSFILSSIIVATNN